MKFSFRRVAVIVSIIMGVVFLYQVYWLKGMYHTTGQQIRKDIYEAMEIADQTELFLRFDMVQAMPDSIIGTHKINANETLKQKKIDSTGETIFYPQRDSSSLSISSDSEIPESYQLFKENSKTIEKLARYLQQGIHQAIDSIVPCRMEVVDSLLQIELAQQNINGHFIVQLIQTSNDSVLTSIPRQPHPGKLEHYDYPFDLYGKHAYRLYLQNPNRQIIKQMAGILTTSVIIFVLLIYIVIYLMRTIRKLQTEEELKTNFTNNMTHELKTPIAVSYAAIDALLVAEQPPNKERQEKYLGIAKEQMEQLTGLVEQILSMSRKDNRSIELNPEKINLPEMVANLEERAKLFSDKEVNFVTDFGVESLTADKMHFFNILNNLIENSIKYGGDKVDIKITSQAEDKHILVQVEDNGPGIEPKYQSRVFDKFYRIPTGNRYTVKGYGLGLFYVKEMTERHGGTVSLESRPGSETVFTLKIPKQ